MKGFLCIHGHFYQPPREDPWTGEVFQEKSAAPFQNWNQRITAECYRANLVAPILNKTGQTVRLHNNYSRISFDFGPTLLSWMEHHAPHVYEGIIRADLESRGRFSGHGNAIAQAYHHSILPLAPRRDKKTEVRWGIRDFAHRFGRRPEGMWLPETAVDLATLEILAEEGIAYTILAPHQGRGPAPGATLDIRTPYQVSLRGDKTLAVFFYDSSLAVRVAFEGLLHDGAEFLHRIIHALDPVRGESQLVSIATDGESYGHHHRFGDMALAYVLNTLETPDPPYLTNFGEFLSRFPPKEEAEIVENTSWSCAHGVERWRGDCGCKTGGPAEWNQAWRAPLREAVDDLRGRVEPVFEREGSRYFRDPWEARDDFIELKLDPSEETQESFFSRHAGRALGAEDKAGGLKLLQMQDHLLMSATSCGWFFDDISGLETGIILKHAAWVIESGRALLGIDWEPEFLRILEKARSNLPQYGNGAQIYRNRR